MKFAIHIFIACTLSLSASCRDNEPTINIKKEGEIGWGEKTMHYTLFRF